MVKNFIENYKDLVPKLERDENLEFAKIQILFGQKKYDEIVSAINNFDFTLFTLKMQSRWYALVVHFITFDNLDFFESQLSSFTQFQYYNKKRMSKRIHEGGLNLAKILKFAIGYNTNFNLENELEKHENIVFKQRLISIFEERDLYIKKHNIQV